MTTSNTTKLNTHRDNRVYLVPAHCALADRTMTHSSSQHRPSSTQLAYIRQTTHAHQAAQRRTLISQAENNYRLASKSLCAVADPYHAPRVYYQTINGCIDEGLVHTVGAD